MTSLLIKGCHGHKNKFDKIFSRCTIPTNIQYPCIFGKYKIYLLEL